MAAIFHNGIKEINQSEKPIATAWRLSYKHLGLEPKVKKLMEILSDHENLFINYNPYHNHYHLAEVIWGCAFLIKREGITEKYSDTMIILLLAATFHNADHQGRTNKYSFENEERASIFFKSWWKNNSLFVENIVSVTPVYTEQAITELILFTDLTSGNPKVLIDYEKRRDAETFGLKLCRLKKILNEANFLIHCLPHYGFNKTELILKESSKNLPSEKIWLLLLDFYKQFQLKSLHQMHLKI